MESYSKAYLEIHQSRDHFYHRDGAGNLNSFQKAETEQGNYGECHISI